ncbi:hypothetical protein HPB50_012044 [Hyalomma asiaticum]|uniref:Uncharacterized protein n=1 Tax=Hyalomma asiaticum TaxID=266040 RepID=A0ACB7TF76_HYAAI|nr:hypothetical protein HPB50_012044 [Hyalomma asiaticum]
MMQRAKHQGREKTCFVPLCRSGYRSNPDKVSMFAVPSDASRLAEWDMDATWTMVPILGNHESEILPFPNEEKEFELPESEFGELLAKYREADKDKASVEGESSKESQSSAAG